MVHMDQQYIAVLHWMEYDLMPKFLCKVETESTAQYVH